MLKSGFYNSLNGDRKYSMEDLSAIFNGVINDGIFMSVGGQFIVSPNSNNKVAIAPGRAWFNGTYSYMDTIMLLDLPQPDLVQNRIDLVVLEINKTDLVRENTFKCIEGVPAENPVAPNVSQDVDVHQYVLAEIYRPTNTHSISSGNITNKVGTSGTPFVTGILETMDIDALITQWGSQWDTWESSKQTEIINWFDSIKDQVTGDLGVQVTQHMENRPFSGAKTITEMGLSNSDFNTDLSNNMGVLAAANVDNFRLVLNDAVDPEIVNLRASIVDAGYADYSTLWGFKSVNNSYNNLFTLIENNTNKIYDGIFDDSGEGWYGFEKRLSEDSDGDVSIDTLKIKNEIKIPSNNDRNDVSIGCDTDGDTGINWNGNGEMEFISNGNLISSLSNLGNRNQSGRNDYISNDLAGNLSIVASKWVRGGVMSSSESSTTNKGILVKLPANLNNVFVCFKMTLWDYSNLNDVAEFIVTGYAKSDITWHHFNVIQLSGFRGYTVTAGVRDDLHALRIDSPIGSFSYPKLIVHDVSLMYSSTVENIKSLWAVYLTGLAISGGEGSTKKARMFPEVSLTLSEYEAITPIPDVKYLIEEE